MAIGAILDAAMILDMLVEWGVGWRYVLSPSYRRKVHERWRGRSRLLALAEGGFVALSFLLFNGVLAIILWILFVGPIRPVHEWGR